MIRERNLMGMNYKTKTERHATDKDYQLEQVIHQATDITECVQSHDEIRRLKNINEGIVQNMREGALVMDVEGNITFINKAASFLLGYSPEEIIGQQWKAIVPSDQHEAKHLL